MKNAAAKSIRSGRKRYLVAMVLGTALSALGTPAQAAGQVPDATIQAVTDLGRYCTACWRNARLHPDCWPDCTQEVFSRLMERVSPEEWAELLNGEGNERREFLRAIDAVKKRTQRSRNALAVPVDTLADLRNLREQRLQEDRETVQQAARQWLSLRQRRILQMSFEGWSVKDIAAELGLPAARVSDEKYKAVHKLREGLCRHELGRLSG